MWHLGLYIPWRRHFTFDLNSLRKKLRDSLIRLDENFYSGNLYSKPGCHVVSKAFSISKNIAAVDMLLLKYETTWLVRLIY
jgi:hypothetical protein